jgi:hypothetical protein
MSACGSGANSVPDPTTLKIRIHVNGALGENQVWAATSLTGTMVGSSRYVCAAAFYCTASTFRATLAGTPGKGMPPVMGLPAGPEAPGRGGLAVGVLRGPVDQPPGLERPPSVAAGT